MTICNSLRAAVRSHLKAAITVAAAAILCCAFCWCLQLALVNSSVLYVNPSPSDDCVVYTQKRNFAFRQVLLSCRFPAL